MSVNLGFYDLFSYLMPGLLYLYVINEFMRIIGAKFIDVESWLRAGQAPEFSVLLPILLVAYIAGHVFDAIALRFFFQFIYRLRNKEGASSQSLKVIKEKHPELDIKFKSKDWEILFTFLRQRNIDTAQNIDRFQADSVMLRNVALGVLLLAPLHLFLFFSTMTWVYLLITLCEILVCVITISESFKFRMWFFTNIFESSLLYGRNVEEVINYESKKEKKRKTTIDG